MLYVQARLFKKMNGTMPRRAQGMGDVNVFLLVILNERIGQFKDLIKLKITSLPNTIKYVLFETITVNDFFLLCNN